jgi:hypothetical protein
MIKQVPHIVPDDRPDDFTQALEVAYELNAPAVPPLPAELAAPQLMGLRMPAARPHRHKVPLKRLSAVCC